MTTNLKVIVVSTRVKESCGRFSGLASDTENVANARPIIQNCNANRIFLQIFLKL